MSNSVQQSGSRPARNLAIRGGSHDFMPGSLFLLFALELFLMGTVLWSFLINRHSFPDSFSNLTDPVWGLVALAAAGWGTAYMLLSRQATRRWNISGARNLLAIVVASGAILLGLLSLNLATVFVVDPVYMDIRSQFPATGAAAKPESASVIVGDPENGKKWFGMSCVTCHGPTGDGVANAAPSLRASEFLKSATDVSIAALIRNGRAASDPANKTGKVMPAKGGNPFLDESKIADLVAFLQNLDSQLPGASDTLLTSASTDLTALQSQWEQQPPAIVRKWRLDDLATLGETTAAESGSTGMRAFVKANCNKCHFAAVAGQELGPALDQIVKKYPREKLLQHMLEPSAEINEKFQAYTFLLHNGQTKTGIITGRSDEQVELMTDLLQPDQREVILTGDISDQVKSKVSAMPDGLLDVLTREEIAALVAYVDMAGKQIAASSAPQLNRWVVPAATSDTVPTSWATSSPAPMKTFMDSIRANNALRYGMTFSGLFVIATAVLALHFLWVMGCGTAVVMHRELQLSSGMQSHLGQLTFLFWSIGIGWLVLWFLLFFVVR